MDQYVYYTTTTTIDGHYNQIDANKEIATESTKMQTLAGILNRLYDYRDQHNIKEEVIAIKIKKSDIKEMDGKLYTNKPILLESMYLQNDLSTSIQDQERAERAERAERRKKNRLIKHFKQVKKYICFTENISRKTEYKKSYNDLVDIFIKNDHLNFKTINNCLINDKQIISFTYPPALINEDTNLDRFIRKKIIFLDNLANYVIISITKSPYNKEYLEITYTSNNIDLTKLKININQCVIVNNDLIHLGFIGKDSKLMKSFIEYSDDISFCISKNQENEYLEDPISLERFVDEIDDYQYIITLDFDVNGKQMKICYDIRSLLQLQPRAADKKIYCPSTINPFTSEQILYIIDVAEDLDLEIPKPFKDIKDNQNNSASTFYGGGDSIKNGDIVNFVKDGKKHKRVVKLNKNGTKVVTYYGKIIYLSRLQKVNGI